ncbi:MAG: mechanosensitive ion channel family protein [Bacteroidota bacterium]
MSVNRILRCFIACLIFPLSVIAQEDLPDTTLTSPYDVVYTHLHYLQPENRDVDIAAKTIYGFDDPKVAREIAVRIKQVLDGKGLYVRLNTIPKDSLYRDSVTNKAEFVLFPSNLPEVSIEKVGRKWYYSQRTVDLIGETHRKLFPYGSSVLMNLAPKFGASKILGLAVWQYLGFLIILLGSIILYKIFSWILRGLINLTTSTNLKEHLDPKVIWGIARVLSLLAILNLVKTFVPALLLPIQLSSFLVLALKIAGIVFVVVLALRLVDFVMGYFDSLTDRTESKLDDQLLPIIRKFLQVLFVTAGIIQGLRALDVNVTALIAGVSIGGLALALAAQDTVKNLIGSFMIFLDQPFQIGDYIQIGSIAGVVEEVGMRSTRLRGGDTAVHTVPNGNLANMMVKNLGVRTFRQYRVSLGITYDTPPMMIDKFIEGIREIVLAHPGTRKEGWQVHLNEFAASSLNIMISGHFDVETYADELSSRHQIMIGILKLAEGLNVRLAFPSQTLYIEEFPEKKNSKASHEKDPAKIEEQINEILEKYREEVNQPKENPEDEV